MSCVDGRFERLLQMQRRYGAGAVLQHLLGRLTRRVAALDFSRLLWLDAAATAPASPDEQFTFRFLNADEVRCFAADAENCLNADLADQLVRSGNRENCCFAAFADGRLAAYGWYAMGTVDARHCGGVGLSLPAGAAYFYNGFTRPEFRGRGVYVALIGRGLSALGDRGVRHLLTSVHWTNWAALRSCRRLGFADLGCFWAIGCGRCRLVFPPRAARRRGIEFRRQRNG